MRRPDFIAKQAGMPSGLLGRVLAGIMFYETAAENDRTLRIMNLRPDDRVLEIGFGHGRTLASAAKTLPQGFAAGLDVSPLMVKTATEHYRDLVQQKRIEFKLMDGNTIPYRDSTFDQCYAVHSLYFWPDPARLLREIRRTLKPNGKVVLCFRYDAEALASFPASVYQHHTPQEVLALLQEAGFKNCAIESQQESSRIFNWAIAFK
jgi:SAM-dependent methyltransferase